MQTNIIVLILSVLSVGWSLWFLLLECFKLNLKKKKQVENKVLKTTNEPETVQLLKETIYSTMSIVDKDELLVVNSAPINGKKLKIKPRHRSDEKAIFKKHEVKFL